MIVLVGICSWDFIYAEYVMAAGHYHRSIVWQVNQSLSALIYTVILVIL